MVRNRLTPIAQKLRRETTDAEQRLWSRLRGKQLGVQFTRQLPIGSFVVDFACRSAKLAVEADGGQHSERATDTERARVIEAFGYRLIRFWNNDILDNTDGVVTIILEELAIAGNQE